MDNLITTVVNKHHGLPYDVYIGRGSIFGNPFIIGEDGTREEVVNKYREYFYNRINTDASFRLAVLSLNGKRLACFCAPKSCHGDIIKEYLDKTITSTYQSVLQEFFLPQVEHSSSL
jgi:hypothetical protein